MTEMTGGQLSEGWQALFAAVAQANALVAASAQDEATAKEGEAYVTRVMASGLGGAVLGHLFRHDGLSRALPCYGGPNPDYIMRFAPVEAAGCYRVEGRLNGSERVALGLYRYSANGAPIIAEHIAFDAENSGPDGRFSVDLGAGAEEKGGLGIVPDVRVMLARVLHRDPSSEPASLRLLGGSQEGGLTLAMGSNDAALAFVARSLGNNVREYLKWTEVARDLANRFDQAPVALTETVQGDGDTQYYLGGFDLASDEYLEVIMPEGLSGYWSLHAYNIWYEHLQVTGVHDRNAQLGEDGRIRISVGPNMPENTPNLLNTLGRQKGAFICRIIGEGACPEAVLRKVGRLA